MGLLRPRVYGISVFGVAVHQSRMAKGAVKTVVLGYGLKD